MAIGRPCRLLTAARSAGTSVPTISRPFIACLATRRSRPDLAASVSVLALSGHARLPPFERSTASAPSARCRDCSPASTRRVSTAKFAPDSRSSRLWSSCRQRDGFALIPSASCRPVEILRVSSGRVTLATGSVARGRYAAVLRSTRATSTGRVRDVAAAAFFGVLIGSWSTGHRAAPGSERMLRIIGRGRPSRSCPPLYASRRDGANPQSRPSRHRLARRVMQAQQRILRSSPDQSSPIWPQVVGLAGLRCVFRCRNVLSAPGGAGLALWVLRRGPWVTGPLPHRSPQEPQFRSAAPSTGEHVPTLIVVPWGDDLEGQSVESTGSSTRHRPDRDTRRHPPGPPFGSSAPAAPATRGSGAATSPGPPVGGPPLPRHRATAGTPNPCRTGCRSGRRPAAPRSATAPRPSTSPRPRDPAERPPRTRPPAPRPSTRSSGGSAQTTCPSPRRHRGRGRGQPLRPSDIDRGHHDHLTPFRRRHPLHNPQRRTILRKRPTADIVRPDRTTPFHERTSR